MPDSNEENWVVWEGGEEPPMAVGTPIEVRHRDGEQFKTFAGSIFASDWTIDKEYMIRGDIVAYRYRQVNSIVYAIMCNDRVEHVLIGSKVDAENKMSCLVREYVDRTHTNTSDAVIYWSIKEVPCTYQYTEGGDE